MSNLVVVTASYVPTFKQPTHFRVVDAGLSYVREGQILTLKRAAQLMRECYSANSKYNPVLVPLSSFPKRHAK